MSEPRKISDAGRALIVRYEGLSLKPYKDPVGIWTIGYGHTGRDSDRWGPAGHTITLHHAEEILEHDLEKFEAAVEELCPGANANQFSALVSFAFNVGATRLSNSTLRRKFLKSDFQGAADEFPKWVHAGGKVLPGLVKRRAAERTLFLTPVS